MQDAEKKSGMVLRKTLEQIPGVVRNPFLDRRGGYSLLVAILAYGSIFHTSGDSRKQKDITHECFLHITRHNGKISIT
jgi:hypothetical protein